MQNKWFTTLIGSRLFVLALFALVAFVAYYSSLNSSFHLDDARYITENRDIMVKKLTYPALKKAALTGSTGLRSVSNLSFAYNYYFSRLNPTDYHVVNTLIHIFNAFLIYLILRAILGFSSADKEKKGVILMSAFFTALLWLCHPLNSHTVILISNRTTLLMTMFFLLAFYCYIKWYDDENIVYLALTGALFMLSMLSNQSGIMLLLVLLLYDLVFVKKGDIKRISNEGKLKAVVVFLLFIVIILLYKGQIAASIKSGYANLDFTMFERVLTQPRMIFAYLSLLLLPLPGRLSYTHDIVKSTSLFSPVTTLIALVALIIVLFTAFRCMKKAPYLSFAILWFFLTIAIESSILPLELLNEHRMYLPGIFLIGVAVDYIVRHFCARRGVVVILSLSVLSVTFIFLTSVRGKVWKDELTLWGDTAAKYPDDPRARYGLGHEYFHRGDLAKTEFEAVEQYKKAIVEFRRSLMSAPEDSESYYHIAMSFKKMKKYELAVENFERVVAGNKRDGDFFFNSLNDLGDIYMTLGKHVKAQKVIERLIGHDPSSGKLFYKLGRAFQGQGKYASAIKEYNSALDKGYLTAMTYVEAVRCMLIIGDTKGADYFYSKHKRILFKLCIGDFIMARKAEFKGDIPKSVKMYKSYLSCKNSKKSFSSIERFDPYPEEAKQRLKILTTAK